MLVEKYSTASLRKWITFQQNCHCVFENLSHEDSQHFH